MLNHDKKDLLFNNTTKFKRASSRNENHPLEKVNMTKSMNGQMLSKHKIKRDNLFNNPSIEEQRKMLEDRFKNDSNYADLRVKIGVKQEHNNGLS